MRVVNKNHESFTHYIGRGSVFGNPFRIGIDGTRDEVIKQYEFYARHKPELMNEIKSLPENAVLGCFCFPRQCHGDVIIKIWKELSLSSNG